MKLAIVTATIDLERATTCTDSWLMHARMPVDLHIVLQGATQAVGWSPRTMKEGRVSVYANTPILGVVPAFAIGVQKALEDGADIIACLHDDLEIESPGWDRDVLELFAAAPQVGLCGFGGATGAGADDIYQSPYNPMQLARQHFLSNMRHAEAHGERTRIGVPVACLDGFSQIGRREFWLGYHRDAPVLSQLHSMEEMLNDCQNLFSIMQQWGLVHHAYDLALGCWAARLNWKVMLLPLAVHHHGGLTAVADRRYLDWALDKFHTPDWTGTKEVYGDAALWIEAHRLVYENFRDCLPIRT